jgi:hypothetical protein
MQRAHQDMLALLPDKAASSTIEMSRAPYKFQGYPVKHCSSHAS